jgi:hypothetical protein
LDGARGETASGRAQEKGGDREEPEDQEKDSEAGDEAMVRFVLLVR